MEFATISDKTGDSEAQGEEEGGEVNIEPIGGTSLTQTELDELSKRALEFIETGPFPVIRETDGDSTTMHRKSAWFETV